MCIRDSGKRHLVHTIRNKVAAIYGQAKFLVPAIFPSFLTCDKRKSCHTKQTNKISDTHNSVFMY